jgi:hypothetical protein
MREDFVAEFARFFELTQFGRNFIMNHDDKHRDELD